MNAPVRPAGRDRSPGLPVANVFDTPFTNGQKSDILYHDRYTTTGVATTNNTTTGNATTDAEERREDN